MPRRHSFATLLPLLVNAFAVPLADDDDGGDDDDDDWCGGSDTQPPVQHLVASSTPVVHVPDSPASMLTPYQRPPMPHPSPSQHPHATLPVSHRSQIPAMIGVVVAIVVAFVAFALTARYVARRRQIAADPFKDPRKPRFWSRRSIASKKRLSDESWVSPTIPSLISPGSPLSQSLELSRYAYTQRKLVPEITPVGTPSEIEFGCRLELPSSERGSVIPVPSVRVPSPVYISPFSPSPSLSSTSSSLSPTPSTEPLSSPSPNPARLSRLLSSTFRDSRSVTPPARPTTAHLIQTARSYAHAYRPSSATTTSLYTPPTPSARLGGTRSRTSFYPSADVRAAWESVRDTYSTVTTSETDTIPNLLRTTEAVSPFADPGERQFAANASGETAVGTSLGLKVRLSDASEHANYRLREKERERQRQRNKDSTVHRRSRSLEDVRQEFKLRDSERVLREIGW